MIINNTPIEEYDGIYVKREDLCALPPLPPFAKVRGLEKHLQKLKREGVTVVGYTETSISMAGIGICAIARELGMTAVIYNPVYKESHEVLEYHKSKWIEFGAEIRNVKAGMAKVNYYISRNALAEEFGPKAVLLPLGLPLLETVVEVAKEVKCSNVDRFQTIVMCIGSGTMAAGVLRGIREKGYNIKVRGVLCRESCQQNKKREKIVGAAGYLLDDPDFKLIDMGYEYTDRVVTGCPFPCNPYYDLKAWSWLKQNKNSLEGPILFWNIGA
jgi:1-aminocyclopropane-1-carboxylate deaminase/D-cysteine desulfhydrase-like pyridoxal-dependent ACC family enzyme